MKLSIILPVFNVAKYLERCVKSLIKQENDKIEFIFVDDGSTDDSLEVLNSLKILDNRIRVYTKKNEGSGLTRNFGLSKSIGKYVYFMDPDDWIEYNFIDIIFDKIERNPDMLIFGYNIYRDKKKIKTIASKYAFFVDEMTLSGETFKKVFETLTLFQIWNKVYRKDFLVNNKIYFSNQKTGQDALFNIKLAPKLNKVMVSNEVLYNYNTKRIGSAQTSFNPQKILDNINIANAYLELYEYLKLDTKDPKEYFVYIFYEDLKNKIKNGYKPYWLNDSSKKQIYKMRTKDLESRKSKIKLLLIKFMPKKLFIYL